MKHWYVIDESVEVLADSSEDALKSVCKHKRITLWDLLKSLFKRGE